MIDEKLFIKKLMESGLEDSEDKWLLRFVQEIIDGLPKVGATEINVGFKWISVTERLPEEEGWYLETIICGTTKKTGFGLFKNGIWEHFDDEIETIAWMPLPDPYIEKPDFLLHTMNLPDTAADGRESWKDAVMRHFEKVE